LRFAILEFLDDRLAFGYTANPDDKMVVGIGSDEGE
jgi:hypothetical protein